MIGLIVAVLTIVGSVIAGEPIGCRICGGPDSEACVVTHHVADKEGLGDMPLYPVETKCPSKVSKNVWDFVQQNVQHSDLLSFYKEQNLTSNRDSYCMFIDKSRYIAEKSKATKVCSTQYVEHLESSDFIVGCVPGGLAYCLFHYPTLLNITRDANGKAFIEPPDLNRTIVNQICGSGKELVAETTAEVPPKKCSGNIVRGYPLICILTVIIFLVRFA